METTWTLALAQKRSLEKKERTRRCQELEGNTGSRGGGTRDTEGSVMGEPPGANRDLIIVQGRQRGVQRTQETAVDSGMWRRAQSRVVEAGGCKVGTTSRWTSLRARRGGGEWVKERGATTKNTTNGVVV